MLPQYSDTGNNFIHTSSQIKSFHKNHLIWLKEINILKICKIFKSRLWIKTDIHAHYIRYVISYDVKGAYEIKHQVISL